MFNRYVLIGAITTTAMIVSMAMFVKFIGNNFIIGTLVTLVVFYVVYNFLLSCVKDAFSMKIKPKMQEALAVQKQLTKNKPGKPGNLTNGDKGDTDTENESDTENERDTDNESNTDDKNGKNGKKEGFTTLKNGEYPIVHSKLPLDDWYPVVNMPTDFKYSTLSKLYPRFPAKSMRTNNIRYWANPDNGTCVIPHQCQAMYGNIVPEKFVQPTAPQWGGGLRVNFYETCSYGSGKITEDNNEDPEYQ